MCFRSPGKILGITVPTFEALAQFGIAEIKTQNIGEVEASYSLTVCDYNTNVLTYQYYFVVCTHILSFFLSYIPVQMLRRCDNDGGT